MSRFFMKTNWEILAKDQTLLAMQQNVHWFCGITRKVEYDKINGGNGYILAYFVWIWRKYLA